MSRFVARVGSALMNVPGGRYLVSQGFRAAARFQGSGSISSYSSNASAPETDLKQFKYIKVTVPSEKVYHVELNRPKQANALNDGFWKEIKECFDQLSVTADCRAIVLSGAGKHFCSGIDVNDLKQLFDFPSGKDGARIALRLRRKIREYQASLTAIEQSTQPVIAATHAACIGAGIDMISCTDIRLSCVDSKFSIKEVDIGLAADVGTLQRVPKIVTNHSLLRELVYTAREFGAEEAQKSLGLVSEVLETKEATVNKAIQIGEQIAAKSPVAVAVSKTSLNYSREHTVEEGLKHIADYNMCMLQSEDLSKSALALMARSKPDYNDL